MVVSPRRTLIDVLEDARRVGSLGSASVAAVIEHSMHFVRAVPEGMTSVVDLGSGAGVPGLILAVERPNLRVTMIDRRATRMDALTRAVQALGLGARVRVVTGDAHHLATLSEYHGQFDVAVSRGLGNPDYTARLARPFLREGGFLIVSEPPSPSPERWNASMLAKWDFDHLEHLGPVARLRAVQKSQ